MRPTTLLHECLLRAGMGDVVAVDPATGGLAALAGVATRRDAPPVFVKAAVSYMWAEVDLAHVWSTAPPPEAQRFFEVYEDLACLDRDWRARMPIIQLRQHLAVLAQFEDVWGAGDQVRATLAPFRART